MPEVSQEQVVVLKVNTSQQFTCTGCDGWVPVTSQAHDAVLNAAVSQHANVGCDGWVPVTSHEQVVVLNAADS